jgi:biopolymer transport protein TolR
MASSGGNDEFEITNINVTPLVDIMLVLLIIFLVTATYIVKEAIPIELPKTSAVGESTPHTIQVVITKEGKTYVDGSEMTDAALVEKIRGAASAKGIADVQAIISADRDAHHGFVVHALDVLKTEGVTRFAIQVEKRPVP